MAFAAVQSATVGSQTTNAAVPITVSATTQYNLVVVHLWLDGTTDTLTSVTDSASNAYVVSAPKVNGGQAIYQAYGIQTTGGATTVTATTSGTTNNKRIAADEYSGFASSATNANILDATSSGSGTGTNLSVTTMSLITGDLIVATMHASGGAISAGTDYTIYASGFGGTPRGMYRLSGTTSETAPASTSSNDWAEIANAFNAAGLLRTTKTEVAGTPVEALTTVKTFVQTNTDVAGAPVDSADLDYGWQEASKSSAPTWTPQPKS